MDFLFNFLRSGGPFMFLVILAGLIHFGLCVAHVLVGSRRSLAPLLLASLGTIILTGALGTVQGLMLTFSAIAMAAPEMKQAMMANGASISLYTTAAGLFFGVLGTWAAGIACFLVPGGGAGAKTGS